MRTVVGQIVDAAAMIIPKNPTRAEISALGEQLAGDHLTVLEPPECSWRGHHSDLDVIGVRLGRSRTRELTHLRGVG